MKPLIDQVDHKFTVDYLHAKPIASSPVISASTIVIVITILSGFVASQQYSTVH